MTLQGRDFGSAMKGIVASLILVASLVLHYCDARGAEAVGDVDVCPDRLGLLIDLVEEPQLFAATFLAVADDGFLYRLQKVQGFLTSGDARSYWLENAQQILDLSQLSERPNLALLAMYDVEDLENDCIYLEHLSGLILNAIRHEKSLGEILNNDPNTEVFKNHWHNAVLPGDYAARIAGRWCDSSGLVFDLRSNAIENYSFHFEYDFSDSEFPTLVGSSLTTGGKQKVVYLRYRDFSDVLYRKFFELSDWQRMTRCPLGPDREEIVSR